MFDYGLVNRALLLQIVFWIYLYKWDRLDKYQTLFKGSFYLGCWFLAMIIIAYQPQVGYFNWFLMLQYLFFIMLSTLFLSERFNFREALCLGFLVVFLNSFYWETFYHVIEFIQLWPLPLTLGYWYERIPQWARLLPALWLRGEFHFKEIRYLAVGFGMSLVLTLMKLTVLAAQLPHTNYWYFLPIHRSICLAILVYTIYISPQRTKVY